MRSAGRWGQQEGPPEGFDLGFPDRRQAAAGPVPSPVTMDSTQAPPARGSQIGGANDLASEGGPRETSGTSALSRQVAGAIGRAVERARVGSKGKVTGRNSVVAVHVLELPGGATLVDIQGQVALIPASNLKLLTVAAALVMLGDDACFETPFLARGPLAGGTLEGDLVVRGGGDPLYRLPEDSKGEAAGDLAWWFEPAAAQLRAAGIERVSGRLILDTRGWLEPGPPEGWPSASEHWKSYCARCAGLNANAGSLTVTVTPGTPGAKARVELRPRFIGLNRKVGVATRARGSGNDVRVGATASRATVGGSIAAGLPPFVADFAHPDPVDLFGHAALGGLKRAGIAIAGGVEMASPEPASPGDEGGREVARMRTPLASTLIPILRDSNNAVADQLFLALGHQLQGRGDRAAGEAAVRLGLERLGTPARGLRMLDGSGLSKVDRTTPHQLTGVLAALAKQQDAGFRALREALPVAGRRGKLGSRMRDSVAAGRVRAKTGFVNGASGLSGYVETLDGRVLAFSILVNYPRVAGMNNLAWKPMQDEICTLLVESEMSK